MASKNPEPILITSWRGGLNNCDPPIALALDQCTIVENIDYERATVGAKRRGQQVITTSGATINSAVVFLHRHLPTGDESQSTLWAASVSGTSSIWNYKDTAWHEIVPTDALAVASGQYAIRGLTLHGKSFFAYPLESGVDRLMVYDGMTFRRTGLPEPQAPTVVTSGSGAFSGDRLYRVRYKVAGTGLDARQSEPSESTAFTPPGTGAGATITKPAATGEGEDTWLIEESVDEGDTYYVIAELDTTTTDYTDTLAPTSVPDGALAAPIGTYALQHSPKFLLADADRLIIGGSQQQPRLQSRISWSPVYAAPGIGNDERLDDNQDPFFDLDGYDGGELTDGGGPVNGYMYAFKWQRIFKMIRTGNVKQAYQAIKITSSKGALPRSVVPGLDERGHECLYFLDPFVGPCRIGVNGVESCGHDLTATWRTLNKNAALVSHGVYYALKRTVEWWCAFGDSTTPNQRLMAFVDAFRPEADGVHGGWSLCPDASQQTLASVLYADNINDNTTRSLSLKPYTAASGAYLISEEDIGSTDNGMLYRGRVRGRPFVLAGMLGRTGIRAGALMGTAASGVDVSVTLIRDFGKETSTPIAVSLTPDGNQTTVTQQIDNLKLDELIALEVEVGDAAAADADWEVNMVSLIPTFEEMM